MHSLRIALAVIGLAHISAAAALGAYRRGARGAIRNSLTPMLVYLGILAVLHIAYARSGLRGLVVRYIWVYASVFAIAGAAIVGLVLLLGATGVIPRHEGGQGALDH